MSFTDAQNSINGGCGTTINLSTAGNATGGSIASTSGNSVANCRLFAANNWSPPTTMVNVGTSNVCSWSAARIVQHKFTRAKSYYLDHEGRPKADPKQLRWKATDPEVCLLGPVIYNAVWQSTLFSWRKMLQERRLQESTGQLSTFMCSYKCIKWFT